MRWLPEGRNCFCVWSFWCSELCSVDQMGAVQRGGVLDVRGPEWFYQLFCLLWMSTVLGEWGGGVPMIRSAVRTTLCSGASEVRFGSWAEPDSYWHVEDGFNDGGVDVFQQLLCQVELSQLETEILCLFHNGLSNFRSQEMMVPRNPNDSTAVTVLFIMVSVGGFLLKSTIISTVLSVLNSRLLRLHQTASSLTSCL